MRRFLNASLRVLRVGGFWSAVVLVLPNCGLNVVGTGIAHNFQPGYPQNDAIFCDIERSAVHPCATDEELARGIRLSEAAVALAEGRTSDVALDDSAAAIADCGRPRAVYFQGSFPDGFVACVNCGATIGGGATYADANVACQVQCQDFFGGTSEDGTIVPTIPPTPDTVAFCAARAKASTNFPINTCFMGACVEGALPSGFVDPRRTGEPIIWVNRIGSVAEGAEFNDLRRNVAETGSFDAGAVSDPSQWIAKGDAWFEFGVDPGKTIVAGLSQVGGCAAPCDDTNPSDTTIDFGLLVAYDGRVFVQERGVLRPGPLATAGASDRFRVRVRANGDGTTAQIRYTIVIGSCSPGMVCNETELHTSTVFTLYPLRVDTSLFHANAKITNARLVRIR